jgi:hypothetical protein
MEALFPVVPPTFLPIQRKQSMNSTVSCMVCEMIIIGEPGEIWKDTVMVCTAEISATMRKSTKKKMEK